MRDEGESRLKSNTYHLYMAEKDMVKRTDVNDLIQKAKLKEKNEKRNTVIIVAAAVTVATISGLLVSL